MNDSLQVVMIERTLWNHGEQIKSSVTLHFDSPVRLSTLMDYYPATCGWTITEVK
jgi:hypothetical protein